MDTPRTPDPPDPGEGPGRGSAEEAIAPSRRAERQMDFLESLHELSSTVAVILDSDAQIIYVSPGVTDMLGYSPFDVLARVGLEFLHPDDRELMRRGLQTVIEAPAEVVTLRLRARDAAGEWRWLEETITNRVHDAAIGGFVVNVRDVTAEVEAQAAALDFETRLRAVVDAAQEGILAVDFEGRALFVNQRAAEMLGRTLDELDGVCIPELLAPGTSEQVLEGIRTRLERGPEKYDVHYDHPDGSRRVFSVSASPYVTGDGRFLGSLGMVSDVTAERRAEEVLRRQAFEDPLTGLANRRALSDRLAEAAGRSAGDERHLAVVLMNIDDLKAVNEVHGHEAGDQLLMAVAARLRDVAGPDDLPVRLGGDEFALVLDRPTTREIEQAATRLRAALRGLPIAVEGHTPSATVGLAVAPPQSADGLLRYAGIALDEAKRTGPGGVVLYDEQLARRHRRRRALTVLVRNELSVDEVRLHYQPLVDLRSGRVKGFEALLRMHHPTLGALRPDEIVAAFEATGSSHRLDELVLARACADMKALRAENAILADTYLSVNVSAVTLDRPGGFQAALESVLGEGCVPPDKLVLEVTEGAVMREPERVGRVLDRLTGEGLRLAVDDFGTGYSSLRYLQKLPLSILKVDRSFVAPLAEDQRSRTLAESIVGLAHTVGLDTVAEGVENIEQQEILVALGCGTGQGYLWSPAIPPEEIATLVARLGHHTNGLGSTG